MKIGTLSLNINTDDLNYGAMLHSWAFAAFLEKQGLSDDVEIIDYTTPQLEQFNRKHPIISYIKMHRWKSAVKLMLSANSFKKRLKRFDEFVNKNMKTSENSYTQKQLSEENLKYDCVICESDVIWSPRFFYGKFDETFFLALKSMEDKKKIVYAASTANADFRDNELDSFKELIQYPDYVACREIYGTKLIKECGRADVATVADPVLLLDAEDYNKITAERLIKEKYLLVYIPLNYDSRYQKAAHSYAEKHGLKVVEISYYIWNSFKHKVIPDATIEEFLSLIKNAEVIFTNSFHAVCFSCIFHRQFYAFVRKTGMKTKDLCERLGLTKNYMDVDNFHECAPIDFEEVDKKIKKERESSIAWLENAINGSKKERGGKYD